MASWQIIWNKQILKKTLRLKNTDFNQININKVSNIKQMICFEFT